jgi:hypothetical protein
VSLQSQLTRPVPLISGATIGAAIIGGIIAVAVLRKKST